MGRNNYFQFKQFKIHQEKAAMKVNTDGVLLGAWATTENAETILDVGTGTGVIALMMAQRCSAKITAIEIEENAAHEAIQNIQISSWQDRITVQHISFQQFATTNQNVFDLIISNPPFFSNGVKSKSHSKSIARHNHLLPFNQLIEGCVQLLKSSGKFALILPIEETQQFILQAETEGLFVERITGVKPKRLKNINRYLIEFTKTKSAVKEEVLSIYIDSGTDYTDQYKELTRDFYPKF